MGLMALHIAGRGERPIFFYGQQYMGVLEAYLAAAAFRLFGPSLVALRLGTLLMSVAALGVIYLLARRLYSRGLALLCLGLLALGPTEPLLRELWSGGGYSETLFFGSTVMLLGVWLVQTAVPTSSAALSRSQRLLRALAFASWGLAAGLGLWSDLLVLPFVLASGLLLAACWWVRYRASAWVLSWREWRRSALHLAAAAVGLLLGGFPLLVYALTAPNHNPFAGALSVSQSSNAWRGDVLAQVTGQLIGTFAVALPNITGGAAICPLPAGAQWPLAHASAYALACTGLHALWGLGFVGLLALALVASARMLWRARDASASQAMDRDGLIREAGRVALAGAATLCLLLFVESPVAARAPQVDSRYLLGMLIALPVVLAAPWQAAVVRLPLRRFSLRESLRAVTRRVWPARLGLAAVAAAYLLSFGSVLGAIPAAQAMAQQRAALVAHLEHEGVSRVYGEYWTCGWLIFASHERVVCAALNGHLQPDLDRYLPYREQVAAAPDAAYVFPVDSAQAAAFAAKLRGSAEGSRYAREVYAGYVIYRPLPTP